MTLGGGVTAWVGRCEDWSQARTWLGAMGVGLLGLGPHRFDLAWLSLGHWGLGAWGKVGGCLASASGIILALPHPSCDTTPKLMPAGRSVQMLGWLYLRLYLYMFSLPACSCHHSVVLYICHIKGRRDVPPCETSAVQRGDQGTPEG